MRESLLELLCPKPHMTLQPRGYRPHPSSEHLVSLPEYFLSSAAAEPAVIPVSNRTEGFSGEVMVRSKASGLPHSQLEAWMSAGGAVEVMPLPASTFTLYGRHDNKSRGICLEDCCAWAW